MEYKRTPLPHPVPKSRMAAVAIVYVALLSACLDAFHCWSCPH